MRFGMSGAASCGSNSRHQQLAASHHQEPPMTLILSCITKGEQQTRRTLERLARLGIANQAIIVLHPGDAIGQPERRALTQSDAADDSAKTPSMAGAAASGGASGGAFGWLLGFGILSMPGAILGGAIGAVTGAAIGATQHVRHTHVTAEVQHHYAHRIVDDHAAILVKIDDFRQYETILTAFLDNDCRHILTSTGDQQVVEADQLDVITQHPSVLDGNAAEVQTAAGMSQR